MSIKGFFGGLFSKDKKNLKEPKLKNQIVKELNLNEYSATAVIRLQLNALYRVTKGKEHFDFEVCTKAKKTDAHNSIFVKWKDYKYENDVQKAASRVPYLLRAHGKEFLWLVETRGSLTELTSAIFIEISDEEGIVYRDYGLIGFAAPPTDTANLLCYKNINVLGHVRCEAQYIVSEKGMPVLKEDQKRYYCLPEYTKDKFILDEFIKCKVYKDKDTEEFTVEDIPQKTICTRLRAEDDDETGLLLEDGRVIGIHELYSISEPKADMRLVDEENNEITLHKLP